MKAIATANESGIKMTAVGMRDNSMGHLSAVAQHSWTLDKLIELVSKVPLDAKGQERIVPSVGTTGAAETAESEDRNPSPHTPTPGVGRGSANARFSVTLARIPSQPRSQVNASRL